MLDALARLGDGVSFALAGALPTLASAARPREWLRPLSDVLVGALPLAFVLGVALGAVVWMQARGVLARTAGAAELLPTVLAAAVLLELAPVGAGLIVAARSGAALGAELGSLRLSEQVDALELLGVRPVRRLVAPRVVACVVATPALHVLVAALALGSGYVAEVLTGGTSWLKYRAAVLGELRLADVLPAGLKTVAFGWLVGVAGSFTGLSATGGSEGVGRATTAGVVRCCLLVLAADVFLVGLIRAF